jgi:UDP-N-acetylmuramoyl-L-alanyl-D-glutamate--2,6-diaminopimelate ligase
VSKERPSKQGSSVLRPRSRPGVPLAELISADSEVAVGGITADSRLVEPGDLYVALPGAARHGASFVSDALAAGAVAVLTDEAGSQLIRHAGVAGQGTGSGLTPSAAPGIEVHLAADPRQQMAGLAARIYGCPADALRMLAVTGTNGKTTTTFLLDAALRAAGHRTGVVGTVGYLLNGRSLAAVRNTVTTPESPELQALLGYLREAGADSIAMEVSSHALVLGRIDAIRFDVAAFTNFGRDHLDFHGDEESYFEAKASLFTPERTRHAVVNVDDPRGRDIADRVRRTGQVGLTTISRNDQTADCSLALVETQPDGTQRVTARVAEREVHFVLRLPGEFNVRNALTAVAMLEAAGVDLDQALTGLADARVPGRMQRVDLGPDAPRVYVDFAHTPQAVAEALGALSANRLIAVLGCGGDRDSDKRRPMGAAAAGAADVVIITDDNPRNEEPAAIRAQVLAGAESARRAGHRHVEVIDGGDRRGAIRHALALAAPADAIALLGKGHETGQEISGQVLPFDDAVVAAEEWAKYRSRGAR